MTLTELINRLESGIAEAVAEEARLLASEIRGKTEPTRIKTKRAIRARVSGTRAKVGIYFAERYAGTRTTTHDNFKRHWRELRPKARRRMIARINNAINGK